MQIELGDVLTNLITTVRNTSGEAGLVDVLRMMQMTEENIERYEAGTLTVNDLLLSQPEMFLEGP